jgi:predicted MFS family arabinose efflux permease
VVQSWCMDLAPESMGGTAISLLFGFKSIFSIGTPLFCGAIADLWGIQEVFWCLTLVAFVATALAFILPATEHVKA